jgi:hypothetical protein
MAGPHDPNGPQDPRSRHGRPGGQGPEHGHGGGSDGGPGEGPRKGQRYGQGDEPGQGGRHGVAGGSGPPEPFEPFEPFEPSLPGAGQGFAARGQDPYERPGPYVPEKRTNGYDHDRPPGGPRRIRFARLWAGGVVVALVAALAAAVALLLVRGVLDIPVFAPEQEGTMVPASTAQLALGSALAALAATAVLHLLMLATPQPGRFLGWIIALGTAAVMLLPFTSEASWEAKAGTAGVYLVIGVVIGTLLATVARTAVEDRTDEGAVAGGGRR